MYHLKHTISLYNSKNKTQLKQNKTVIQWKRSKVLKECEKQHGHLGNEKEPVGDKNKDVGILKFSDSRTGLPVWTSYFESFIPMTSSVEKSQMTGH